MPRESKFRFESEQLLTNQALRAKHDKHTASVNTKYGQIRFSNSYIRDNSLDNVFIKFHADVSKRAIGWSILHEKCLPGMKGYRQLVKNIANVEGYETVSYSLCIKKLLGAIHVTDSKTYKHLPIKKYISGGLLDEDIHYVELQ